jgi:phage gpG-like protein
VSDSHVEIVGLDRAAADMVRWAEALGPAVDKATAAVAARAAAAVRGSTPTVTGRLAGSVDVLADTDGVAVGFGAGVPYAGWIEYGGTRGRPYVADGRYLWPTVQTFEDEYMTAAEQAAEDTVSRFSWS